MTELAILFERLGPYHLARLRAASGKGEIAAIECFERDATYAWAVERGETPFHRVTLFPSADAARTHSGGPLRKLEETLDSLMPQAVAVPGWSDPYALGALRWCLKRKVPALVLSESQEADALRRWHRESIKRRIVRLFAAALAGGTRHAAYLEKLGMPRDRIFTPYDVVDNAHFAAGADGARADAAARRGELGLPTRYFLATGRFVAKKNFPFLLRAYAAYRNAHGAPGDWKLVLLGDGEGKAELLALCAQLGLDGHVLLPGFKQYDELPAYYGLAGAFVLPSTVEQWGLVANEALAAGLPLLASERCGCTPDLVREGENGFAFDPFNEGALSALLARIASLDDEALARMGAAGRNVVSRFSPERFAAGLWHARERALKAGCPVAGLLDRALIGTLAGA